MDCAFHRFDHWSGGLPLGSLLHYIGWCTEVLQPGQPAPSDHFQRERGLSVSVSSAELACCLKMHVIVAVLVGMLPSALQHDSRRTPHVLTPCTSCRGCMSVC